MNAAYAYTPDIWPPLAAAVFLAAIGLYSWQRRDVPGARWLAAGTLVGVLWLPGIALEAAAVSLSAKLAWHVYQAIWLLPVALTSVCFALEYVYPGRWLTRRNLALLWIPALLIALVLVFVPVLMWESYLIRPDGTIFTNITRFGHIVLAYGMSMVLITTTAFAWLFIQSPQHRWPVVLMLFGQFAGRVLFLLGLSEVPVPAFFDPAVTSIVITWLFNAIALFGFRILDPVPAARTAALDQMHDAMAVFDLQWRVASLNRAAAQLAGVSRSRARGKSLSELLPAHPDLAARLETAVSAAEPLEVTMEEGARVRCYELQVSPVEDFRRLQIGRLLLMRDVTEQRRARAHILEQQRALAVLEERERLARELHDGVAQGLAAVNLQVNTAKLLLAHRDIEAVADCLETLSDMTLETQANVREYLLAVKTGLSGTAPFFPTLREYLLRFSRQYGLAVHMVVPPEVEARGLQPASEVQLLRIIQEALSNVRKHAHARCVQVTFSTVGDELRVAISDDGDGFDVAAVGEGEGFGLHAMRERAQVTGGSLAVISAPGQGTEVAVVLPRPC